jgi:hypothetical protein
MGQQVKNTSGYYLGRQDGKAFGGC